MFQLLLPPKQLEQLKKSFLLGWLVVCLLSHLMETPPFLGTTPGYPVEKYANETIC